MLEIVLVVVAVFLAWLFVAGRPSDLPPRPSPALPLLGHLPLVGKDPRAKFGAWRRRYGDVFSLYMGSRLVVVLNGYDVIREALLKRADVFSNRPKMFITELITNRGIVFSSGPSWKEQRKVSVEILRSLGMGRHKFAENIQKEVAEFIKVVGDRQGQPTDLNKLVAVSVSNNICLAVFGHRFDYDCSCFQRYLDLIRENFQALGSANLLNYFPWLRFLPGDRFSAKRILRNVAEMERCFLGPQIQQHLDNCNDDEDDCNDFISAYLKQIKERRAKGETSSTINEKNLLWTVSDLFVAGSETVTSTLLWILLYLLHYPHVQERCFRQITDVIGVTSPPSQCHRLELTYVEATILEALRIADVGAMGIQHGLSSDVEFRGFRIPQSAIVVPFLHSALNDADVWGDPDNFRPERFLDASGALVKRNEHIPFSIGRRSCPGEGMARLQLFLYVTSLIQHFRFLPAEEGQLPSLDGIMGFTHSPSPFLIRAVPRHSGE